MVRHLWRPLMAGVLLIVGFGEPVLAQPPVSFKRSIQPILDAQCVACHQLGAASAKLNLEDGLSYAAIVRQKSQQGRLALVEPGQPGASYLVRKLEGSHIDAGGQGLQMPPLAPLSNEVIELVRRWVLSGAPNN